MKIAVLIKQVPASGEVKLHPEKHTIIRDGRPAVTNPFDLHALELGVSLAEKLSAYVTAVTMGIPAAEWSLRDAVARGADAGLLLSDRAFAGADTLATSETLKLGIDKMGGADLIICGKMAVDGDTAQIGPELAEKLGVPHLSDVCALVSAGEKEIVVEKMCDDRVETVKVTLPALITVTRDINLPRLPSIEGIRRGLECDITVCGAADLGADSKNVGLEGSATEVSRVYLPSGRGSAVEVDSVAELVKIVKGAI